MARGEIRNKLDGFIRRYYQNQLIRGVLIGSSLVLAVFLFVNLTEYYGHFGTFLRALFFWGFWVCLAFVLWRWIAIPLAGLYKLGKVISYQDAARIIGSHFASVQDKLLNLLQLEEMSVSHPDSALLSAGIEQKTKELRPVPFSSAINLSGNKKYLRFLVVPLALTGVILIFQSSIITDGANRIMHFNQHFARKAPFQFQLLNKNLKVRKGSDLELKLNLTGNSIPQDVYVKYRNQEIKMSGNAVGEFTYLFKNIQESDVFHFLASGFSSENHRIEVVPVPVFTGSEAIIHYPLYTGKSTEIINGTSDFSVPEGSEIEWTFDTRDAEQMVFRGNSNSEELLPSNSNGRFKIKKKFLHSAFCKVLLRNKNTSLTDTASFRIQVIPDHHPGVYAEKKDDTADIHQFYFLGNANDDYGVAKVTFNYRFIESEDPGKRNLPLRSIPVPTGVGKADVDFYYILHMNALGMSPSDEVEYYFEVWDNDGIHGSKSTRTQTAKLRRQSEDEARKEADKTAGNVKNMMQDAFKNAKQLQKQNQEMKDYLNHKKNMNWEDKSKVEDVLEKQQELLDKIEEIQREKEKLKQQKQEFQGENEQFKERQKQLDELFKQMEDPEIKKLLEEIQKLLDKQSSKEELNDKMEQLQNKNKDMSKDLDKLMEQYKQLQLEQKMNDNIERLEKLAEKEEKLAEKTEGDPKNSKESLEEQKELQKELEDIKKDIQEAQEMNQDLEQPMNLDMAGDENQKASDEMKSAEKNLNNEKNKKAAENQKNAAEQMKQAAKKMKESMEEEQQKRLGEDYQKVRELLENLVEASFDQEEIFSELNTIREYNPRFVELNKRQMGIKEDCRIIEDSLRMLAKRQPMVSTYITREISRINSNMDYALGSLKTRRLSDAAMREQYIMTGLNNLAVMLMESMENMQQQMSSKKKKPGNQSCNNPKNPGQGDKSKGQKLSQGQEQIGKSLQELQKKAQEKRNGKKPGDKEGQRELNKEYAKAALMQEALRRQLQAMRKELEQEGEKGKAASKELQKTEQMMEQQERDLVNKRITPEMIKRQKEIETRMLEHERADRNQQQEEKRESQNPGSHPTQLPPTMQEYMKQKQREREMLRHSPPELTPYYREKSKEYLRSVH
ncbi:MAG: DUF4175 family protein [Bacteroidetes bacterium]|nr:DUF4175 family protein [Bacteroidota bacterium]